MKILAIMGSPRQGDTYHLTQLVEQHMQALGDYEFEYLWLRDLDLPLCRGCYVCLWRGDEFCPHHEVVTDIEQRLLAADGAILASPVYAMDMTAYMKNLFDHLAHNMHRPCFFDQKALLISTAGVAGLDITLKTMSAITFMGFTVAHKLGMVMTAPLTRGEERAMERKAERAARNFHRALHMRGRPSPSLMSLIGFHAQRAFFQIYREQTPADYEYFKERGWFDPKRKYYVDAQVNPLKDWLARAAGALIARQARRRAATLQREQSSTNEGDPGG